MMIGSGVFFAQVASSNIVITPRPFSRDVPRLARNLPLAQLEVFNSSVRSRYRARPNLQRGRASKSARQELICMIDPALCGMKKKKNNKKKKEDDKIKYSRLQSHRK